MVDAIFKVKSQLIYSPPLIWALKRFVLELCFLSGSKDLRQVLSNWINYFDYLRQGRVRFLSAEYTKDLFIQYKNNLYLNYALDQSFLIKVEKQTELDQQMFDATTSAFWGKEHYRFDLILKDQTTQKISSQFFVGTPLSCGSFNLIYKNFLCFIRQEQIQLEDIDQLKLVHTHYYYPFVLIGNQNKFFLSLPSSSDLNVGLILEQKLSQYSSIKVSIGVVSSGLYAYYTCSYLQTVEGINYPLSALRIMF